MMTILNSDRASIGISFSHYVFELFGCPRVAFGTRLLKYERFHIFISSSAQKQPRINEHIDVSDSQGQPSTYSVVRPISLRKHVRAIFSNFKKL